MLIKDHPRAAEFDGVYRIESQHKGKPVLYNRLTGTFLYHFEAKDAWRLGGKHRPDEDLCVSHITARSEGSLPTGAQTWLSMQGVGPAPSAEHTEAVFSVTLLVREPRSFSPEALDLTGLRLCRRQRRWLRRRSSGQPPWPKLRQRRRSRSSGR